MLLLHLRDKSCRILYANDDIIIGQTDKVLQYDRSCKMHGLNNIMEV